jgi:hypothetical protein
MTDHMQGWAVAYCSFAALMVAAFVSLSASIDPMILAMN